MSVLAFDTLHMGGERVLLPDQVQAMEQLRLLDTRLRQCNAQTRLRLAERLCRARAAARRGARRQGRLDGVREVAAAFAEDIRRWRDVDARIEQVLATVLRDATLALPKTLLMEMQLRKCFAELRGAPDLRIHVNAAMYQSVQAMTSEWSGDGQIPACEIVLTEYLPEDAYILETANGMIEGQVGAELAAFCERVTASLRPNGSQS